MDDRQINTIIAHQLPTVVPDSLLVDFHIRLKQAEQGKGYCSIDRQICERCRKPSEIVGYIWDWPDLCHECRTIIETEYRELIPELQKRFENHPIRKYPRPPCGTMPKDYMQEVTSD